MPSSLPKTIPCSTSEPPTFSSVSPTTINPPTTADACCSSSTSSSSIPFPRRNSVQASSLLQSNSVAVAETHVITPTNLEKPFSDRQQSISNKQKPKSNTVSVECSANPTFLSRHRWLMGWNSEEWWPCWIGLFLFACTAIAVHNGIPEAHFLPWKSNPFDSFKTPGNYDLLVLFPLQGGLVWLALWAYGAKNWKLFPMGYLVIYSISFVSKWLAAQTAIKSASLGDSIWAILFGAILRNVMAGKPLPDGRSRPLPPWLKVAQLTELYIATSLVLLCIDFNVLKPMAARALFVSWIDTPTLFILVAMLGASWLKLDLQTSIIMSGATFICGSSAAIAISASLAAGAKADLPIAIISVFTIPSIIILPYIAKAANFSASVSGAWFGGCVDSTGAVVAAATIYASNGQDKTAIDTASVVKMVQNVLIGPISVGVAVYWQKREEARKRALTAAMEQGPGQVHQDEDDDDVLGGRQAAKLKAESVHNQPSFGSLLWLRFPKFVLGFLITVVLFNTVVPSEDRANVNSFAFMVGEWYSTMSFVSIGLGLQFQELRREARLLLKLTTLYGVAQLVDIASTLVLAYVAFDVI